MPHEDQRPEHAQREGQADHGGSVNTEVIVELPGGTEIVSVITKKSVADLALAEGKDVYAVIKASNVMLAVDH